jgi:hypothetical protein
MTQPSLFSVMPHFDGATFDPARDGARLHRQIARIYDLMLDGQWRTVDTIAQLTGDPQPSVSAQLRNLRKPRFGGHDVQRRYHDGVYQFRLGGAR